MGVLVTEAQASERKIAAASWMELDEEVSQVEVIWVDAGYSGQNFARAVLVIRGARVEEIKRIEPGFQVLPKRWVVSSST